MAPIPVPEENSAGFFLHLNFLGEQQAMSGPMEIGESILIQCLKPQPTPRFAFIPVLFLTHTMSPTSDEKSSASFLALLRLASVPSIAYALSSLDYIVTSNLFS